jgi:hypothetical protein
MVWKNQLAAWSARRDSALTVNPFAQGSVIFSEETNLTPAWQVPIDTMVQQVRHKKFRICDADNQPRFVRMSYVEFAGKFNIPAQLVERLGIVDRALIDAPTITMAVGQVLLSILVHNPRRFVTQVQRQNMGNIFILVPLDRDVLLQTLDLTPTADGTSGQMHTPTQGLELKNVQPSEMITERDIAGMRQRVNDIIRSKTLKTVMLLEGYTVEQLQQSTANSGNSSQEELQSTEQDRKRQRLNPELDSMLPFRQGEQWLSDRKTNVPETAQTPTSATANTQVMVQQGPFPNSGPSTIPRSVTIPLPSPLTNLTSIPPSQPLSLSQNPSTISSLSNQQLNLNSYLPISNPIPAQQTLQPGQSPLAPQLSQQPQLLQSQLLQPLQPPQPPQLPQPPQPLQPPQPPQPPQWPQPQLPQPPQLPQQPQLQQPQQPQLLQPPQLPQPQQPGQSPLALQPPQPGQNLLAPQLLQLLQTGPDYRGLHLPQPPQPGQLQAHT